MGKLEGMMQNYWCLSVHKGILNPGGIWERIDTQSSIQYISQGQTHATQLRNRASQSRHRKEKLRLAQTHLRKRIVEIIVGRIHRQPCWRRVKRFGDKHAEAGQATNQAIKMGIHNVLSSSGACQATSPLPHSIHRMCWNTKSASPQDVFWVKSKWHRSKIEMASKSNTYT